MQRNDCEAACQDFDGDFSRSSAKSEDKDVITEINADCSKATNPPVKNRTVRSLDAIQLMRQSARRQRGVFWGMFGGHSRRLEFWLPKTVPLIFPVTHSVPKGMVVMAVIIVIISVHRFCNVDGLWPRRGEGHFKASALARPPTPPVDVT